MAEPKPAKTPSTKYRGSFPGEPTWINQGNRKHYEKLVNDPDLLAEVAAAIAGNKSNAALALAVVPLGFHAQGEPDEPIRDDKMYLLKDVVNKLSKDIV